MRLKLSLRVQAIYIEWILARLNGVQMQLSFHSLEIDIDRELLADWLSSDR
jgi:hypothetical protein